MRFGKIWKILKKFEKILKEVGKIMEKLKNFEKILKIFWKDFENVLKIFLKRYMLDESWSKIFLGGN